MIDVSLTLHVHQPNRLVKNYSRGTYFDNGLNKIVFDRVAQKSYLPTNNILLNVLDDLKSFKIGLSISGVFLEQCEKYNKDVLEGFKQLASTGRVEVLSETYYHSLASLYEKPGEFKEQVMEHRQAIKDLLSRKALGKVLRNTELIYDNNIAERAGRFGFKGIYTEGTEKILEWRSPNYVYKPPNSKIKILLRNYRLSDDIGYRFSSRSWSEWPLTAEKFVSWLEQCSGRVINLYMDYETFGEHHWCESGIFHFLKALPYFVHRSQHVQFILPTEIIKKHKPIAELSTDFAISWADLERDVSAWLRNPMQHECFAKIKGMKKVIRKTNNAGLIRLWRHLQTSDNLYYLCDKWWQEGDIHHYFSHYSTPQEGYNNYKKVMDDLTERANNNLLLKSMEKFRDGLNNFDAYIPDNTLFKLSTEFLEKENLKHYDFNKLFELSNHFLNEKPNLNDIVKAIELMFKN